MKDFLEKEGLKTLTIQGELCALANPFIVAPVVTCWIDQRFL